jgi:vacuolar-type H+-ATPase subunit I/STV1
MTIIPVPGGAVAAGCLMPFYHRVDFEKHTGIMAMKFSGETQSVTRRIMDSPRHRAMRALEELREYLREVDDYNARIRRLAEERASSENKAKVNILNDFKNRALKEMEEAAEKVAASAMSEEEYRQKCNAFMEEYNSLKRILGIIGN